MRNDFTLPNSQGTTLGSVLINDYEGNQYVWQYFIVKVYKLSGAVETLIATSDEDGTDRSAYVSLTCAVPETAMLASDQIRIKVYTDDHSTPTTLRATFTTEALGASQIDAATWTFYCYVRRIYTGGIASYYFYFGTSTYNSRIENFTWTPVMT
jgi:hypothetical protein